MRKVDKPLLLCLIGGLSYSLTKAHANMVWWIFNENLLRIYLQNYFFDYF